MTADQFNTIIGIVRDALEILRKSKHADADSMNMIVGALNEIATSISKDKETEMLKSIEDRLSKIEIPELHPCIEKMQRIININIPKGSDAQITLRG